MTPDDLVPAAGEVVVENIRPGVVTRARAVRIFIGKVLVDFIETFIAVAGAQIAIILLSPPSSVEGWKLIAVQFAAPALSAAVSALRRAWPAIRAWLTGEEPPA